MATITQRLIISLIRGYQVIFRPLLGNRCRFYPSCSDYAIEALTSHGCCKGTGYTLWRLLRCHPLHPGGFDYVPPTKRSGDHG